VAAVLAQSMLVVERADRLLRDLIVSEMAVWAFADVGVSTVTADTGENITEAGNDPSRKLIRQVLNAVADYERSALVAKLRAARDRKKRNGGHAVGCYRFGEHPEKAEEAGTVARIAELRRASPGRKRVTMRKVAEALAASIFLFTSFSMRRATAVARYAQAKKPSLPHHRPSRDLLGFEISGVGYGDEIRSFLGPDLFPRPE
jgi:hypothetical protein